MSGRKCDGTCPGNELGDCYGEEWHKANPPVTPFEDTMEGRTVAEIRAFYKDEEWFRSATDSQIIGAWGQRSEDSCASWMGFGGGQYGRDEAFEKYLRSRMLEDGILADGREAPALRARITELEGGFQRLRKLAEARPDRRSNHQVALGWIKEVCKEMLDK